jgi:hypothetical protein
MASTFFEFRAGVIAVSHWNRLLNRLAFLSHAHAAGRA